MYDTSALKKKGSSVHSNFTVLVHCRENCTNNQCSSRHMYKIQSSQTENLSNMMTVFSGATQT